MCNYLQFFFKSKGSINTKDGQGKAKIHITKNVTKLRSRKCSQQSSCNETWSWKQ